MRLGKISHVDVVANAGSIGSWVIIAINFEGGTLALNGLEHDGNQMSFGFMQFPDGSGLIGSGSVEVTEDDETQSVSAAVGLKSVLKRKLCRSIGVHRLARIAFGDGNFDRITVDGTRRGKDELADAR